MNLNASCHPPLLLAPEADLLLTILSQSTKEEKQNRVKQLLDRNLDWAFIIALASHHRLFPSLFLHLKDDASESIPSTIRSTLKYEYDQNTIHNMILAQELINLQQLLASRHIPFIIYKGLPIAAGIYGSLSSRHVWDIDLLVQKEHIPLIKSLLISNGYQPERYMAGKEEKKLLQDDCEYNFERVDKRVHLEIHWQIIPDNFSGGYCSKHLWECTEEVIIANKKFFTVKPEELLILLCVHGGDKHQWWRLKWLCDIAQLVIRHPNLDWDKVIWRAHAMMKVNSVTFGLYLAETLLNTPIPPEALRGIKKNSQYTSNLGLVVGRMFRPGFGLPGFSEWKQYINHFTVKGTGSSNARSLPKSNIRNYLRAVLHPEWSDLHAYALPDWLTFLHYVLRPLRLFRIHRQRLLWRLR